MGAYHNFTLIKNVMQQKKSELYCRNKQFSSHSFVNYLIFNPSLKAFPTFLPNSRYTLFAPSYEII